MRRPTADVHRGFRTLHPPTPAAGPVDQVRVFWPVVSSSRGSGTTRPAHTARGLLAGGGSVMRRAAMLFSASPIRRRRRLRADSAADRFLHRCPVDAIQRICRLLPSRGSCSHARCAPIRLVSACEWPEVGRRPVRMMRIHAAPVAHWPLTDLHVILSVDVESSRKL